MDLFTKQQVPAEIGSWNLNSLYEYFANNKMPKSITFGPGQFIVDVNKFVTSHLKICKINQGKRHFEPYYDRLVKLKSILENEKKQTKRK